MAQSVSPHRAVDAEQVYRPARNRRSRRMLAVVATVVTAVALAGGVLLLSQTPRVRDDVVAAPSVGTTRNSQPSSRATLAPLPTACSTPSGTPVCPLDPVGQALREKLESRLPPEFALRDAYTAKLADGGLVHGLSYKSEDGLEVFLQLRPSASTASAQPSMTTATEADNALIFNVVLANGLHGQPRLYSHTLTVLPDTAKASFDAAIRALVFGH